MWFLVVILFDNRIDIIDVGLFYVRLAVEGRFSMVFFS